MYKIRLGILNFKNDFCSRQVDRIQPEPRITSFYEKKKVVEKIEIHSYQKLLTDRQKFSHLGLCLRNE